MLSFVVADPDEDLQPSAGARPIRSPSASQVLDLDRRVARLRSSSGGRRSPFGGPANTELAVCCTDPDELNAAYREIVER